MPSHPRTANLTPAAVNTSGRDSLAGMVVAAVVLVALYFGREILMPLVLAALLSFALAPVSTRLRRWGVGRRTAAVVVVLAALVIVAGIAVAVASRLVQLADDLPTYQANIQQKIRLLAPNNNVLQKATKALQQLENEIKTPDPKDAGSRQPGERPPVTVRVEPPPTSALQTLREVAGPLIGPASVIGLVIVFLFFMMLQREDIRDRFIRLVSAQQMHVTTEAIDEAAQRVSRYLLMQLCVNATYGLAIGIGLYLVGVPNALLWGLLGAALRFIPYLGPFIAGIVPVTMAVAVDPGWTMVISTLAIFLVVEMITNNILEPWLYGSSTGLSPVAIVLAAIFWTTLWGPAGLLISTPLTVCLVVLGRYVPQLRFLDVLLGSTPALSPHERFYQRMLAGDVDEGVEISEPYFASGDLAGFHDDIVLAALKLAEADRQRGAITQERVLDISKNIRSVLTDLEDAGDPPPSTTTTTDPPVQWNGTPLVCIGGRSQLDTAAAALLADRLNRIGIGAKFAHIEELASADLRAALQEAEVVAVIYLTERGPVHARQLVRRLRKTTGARILLGFFNGQTEVIDPDPTQASPSLPVDFIAGAPSDALLWINTLARTPIADAMLPAPIPANEADRLAALERTQLLDSPREDAFDDITRDLRTTLGVPIALITLIDESRQFFHSASGLPAPLAETREVPRATSICGHVVAQNELMVIEDVLRDARFANNPTLREGGIRFYAGAPVNIETGAAIGTVCVLDTRPREMRKEDIAVLLVAAEAVVDRINKRMAKALDAAVIDVAPTESTIAPALPAA